MDLSSKWILRYLLCFYRYVPCTYRFPYSTVRIWLWYLHLHYCEQGILHVILHTDYNLCRIYECNNSFCLCLCLCLPCIFFTGEVITLDLHGGVVKKYSRHIKIKLRVSHRTGHGFGIQMASKLIGNWNRRRSLDRI